MRDLCRMILGGRDLPVGCCGLVCGLVGGEVVAALPRDKIGRASQDWCGYRKFMLEPYRACIAERINQTPELMPSN